MIYIDERGVQLLICDCGHEEQTTSRICSSCKSTNKVIRSVNCADLYHNEPCGCKNPECWKYVKEDEL